MKFKPGTLIRSHLPTGGPDAAFVTLLVLGTIEKGPSRRLELGEMPHYLILWNEHVEYWKGHLR